MDPHERQPATDRLALLEAILRAFERRHGVVEAIWAARDRDEAGARIRDLLELPAGVSADVVLDVQFSRLTAEARAGIADEAARLRESLG